MAKKVAKSKFEVVRQAVQFFTIAAAITVGVVTIISLATGGSDFLISINDVFIALTMFGGIAMGALYAVKLLKLKE